MHNVEICFLKTEGTSYAVAMNEENTSDDGEADCKENDVLVEVFELNNSATITEDTISCVAGLCQDKEEDVPLQKDRQPQQKQQQQRRRQPRKPLRIIQKKSRNHLQKYNNYRSALADKHPVVLGDDERMNVKLPTASSSSSSSSSSSPTCILPKNRQHQTAGVNQQVNNDKKESSSSPPNTTETATSQFPYWGAGPFSAYSMPSLSYIPTRSLQQPRISDENGATKEDLENDNGCLHTSFLRQKIRLHLGATPAHAERNGKEQTNVKETNEASAYEYESYNNMIRSSFLSQNISHCFGSAPPQSERNAEMKVNNNNNNERNESPEVYASNCNTTDIELNNHAETRQQRPLVMPERNQETPSTTAEGQSNCRQSEPPSSPIKRAPWKSPPTPCVSPEQHSEPLVEELSNHPDCNIDSPETTHSLNVEGMLPCPVSPQRNPKQELQEPLSDEDNIARLERMGQRLGQQEPNQQDDCPTLLLHEIKQPVTATSPTSVIMTPRKSSAACPKKGPESLILYLEEYSSDQYSLLLDEIYTNHNLERLAIYRHRLDQTNVRTEEEVQALFQILRHRSSNSLRELELWNFQTEDVPTLAQGLQNSFDTLECLQLHLRSGTITPDLTTALGTLSSLVSFEVGVHARFQIAPLLKRPQSLKILGIVLDHYELEVEDVAAVAQALQGDCAVEVLDIEPVMQPVSLRLLTTALYTNRSLETIQFTCGCETIQDGDDTLAILLGALMENRKLRVIWNHHYESITVSNVTKQRVLQVLGQHPTIEEFDVFAEDPVFANKKNEVLDAQRNNRKGRN